MDNKPYQSPQPDNNVNPPRQPWEQNQNGQQHGHGNHEGHSPHHGHHQDRQAQPHQQSYQQHESPQPDIYPTQIPPEVLEHHAQYAPQPSAAGEFVSPGSVTDTLQPSQSPLAPYIAAPSTSAYASNQTVDDIAPIAVVQALSVRGVEYWMMTMTLYLGSAGILGILLALVNGGVSFEVLSFPISLLLVCLPIFSYLFLRLKKAELVNPKLRLDPSKRKLTQFTQVITFAICLFDIVGIVFAIIASIGGHGFGPLWKYILNSIIVFLVAGGILYYYWNDEHPKRTGRF